MATPRIGFGVDIGGTGIKGAPVDLRTGTLLSERIKLPTPSKSTPDAVGKIVGEVVNHFGWTGPIGVTFPAVVKDGRAMTAANVDKSWIGTSIHDAVRPHVAGEVIALNDADAAGLGEARFGAAKGRQQGVVLMVTLGTGIGSALMLDGHLFPSAELGHLEVDGKEAEKRASALVRERDDLSWKKWAKQLQKVLATYEMLFWPDLIVIGGGVSAQSEHFLPLLKTRAELVPAALLNTAGIVGAAIWADEHLPRDAGATFSKPFATTATGSAAAVPTTRTAPAKKTAPAKRAPARKAAAKRAPARKTAAAKKTTPAKRAPARKTAAAKKAAPAKRVPAKKAPIRKAAPARRAAPARKAAAKKAAAKSIRRR